MKPRPIKPNSADARRLKVGKLNATQRSLAYLRKQGYRADVAEKFVTHGGTKAQEDYIDELVSQRASLIERLRTLPSEAEIKRFLAGLQEPVAPTGLAGYRKDLFGFIDIEAIRGDETLAVQTTSFQQVGPHLLHFRSDPELRETVLDWIGGRDRRLVIHGWRCMEVAKKGGKGTKAEWQVRELWVDEAELRCGKRSFDPITTSRKDSVDEAPTIEMGTLRMREVAKLVEAEVARLTEDAAEAAEDE